MTRRKHGKHWRFGNACQHKRLFIDIITYRISKYLRFIFILRYTLFVPIVCGWQINRHSSFYPDPGYLKYLVRFEFNCMSYLIVPILEWPPIGHVRSVTNLFVFHPTTKRFAIVPNCYHRKFTPKDVLLYCVVGVDLGTKSESAVQIRLAKFNAIALVNNLCT